MTDTESRTQAAEWQRHLERPGPVKWRDLGPARQWTPRFASAEELRAELEQYRRGHSE